jgi:hypothetical protein
MLPRLALLAGCIGLAELTAAEAPAAQVDDPAALLAPDPAAAKELGARLAAYEHSSGIRMIVQFHAKSPPAEEDKVAGAYMRALSARLGTLQHGVLVVYFADDPDWRVWIGDDLAPAFAGKPGTVKELTASGAIHDVKEALLTNAKAKADAAFGALRQAAPADRPPTPAQYLRLQTDALLEALMAKLGPK